MLTLRVLGDTTILVDDREIPLRLKEAALLSYLSEHSTQRHLSRDAIASKFWPRSDTARSLRSLSQLVYQIKRKVPELEFPPNPRLLFHGHFSSDVQALRQAAKAGSHFEVLALYRGPFLGGCSLGASGVDAWIEGVNGEITSFVVSSLEHCAVHAITQPDRRFVEAFADALIVDGVLVAPALVARVMICFAEGDEEGARRFHGQLADENSECPPYSELQSISNGQNSKTSTDRWSTTVRFVGRNEELDALQERWLATRKGCGQMVLISGEPGIGKTRLANQCLRRVAIRGGRVWIARCLQVTRRLPYSTLRELWEDHVAPLRNEYNKAAHAFAVLDELFGGTTGVPTDVSEQSKYRVLEALTTIAISVSTNNPLAILVDDIQWADDFTAHLLTLWALRLAEWRMMLMLTMRTQEAEVAPEWIANELSPALHIRLGQLSIESAGELVKCFETTIECVFSEGVRNRAIWQSAGRPLLLLEALLLASNDPDQRTPPAGVYLPETAEALLVRRFRNLPAEAHWVVGMLAVIGESQETYRVASICGLSDSVAASCLETLCSRGILQLTMGKVGFSHELMRETAYRQLAPTTRALLHGRVADLLGMRGADDGILAQHLAEAGDGERAGLYALRAAERAQKAALYSDCEYYYQLALRVGSTAVITSASHRYALHLAQVGRVQEVEPLLAGFGTAQPPAETTLLSHLVELERALVSGDVAMAELLVHARHIIAMAETVESADLALALGMLFDIAYDASSLEFGTEVAEALGRAAKKSQRPLFRRQVEGLVSLWEGTTIGYQQGLIRLGEPSVEGEDESATLTRVLTTFAKGTLLLLAGALTHARREFERCLRLAQAAGDLRRQTATYVNSALVLMELGEFESARRQLEAVLSSPNLAHRLRAYANLAILHYEEGADALALGAIQTVQNANASYASTKYSTTAAAVAGLIAQRAGHWNEAADHFRNLEYHKGSLMYLHGDLNYTVPFVADMLVHAGQPSNALVVLEGAEIKVGGRDRICALRLQQAKARVIAVTDRDKAFAVARSVHDDASRVGAVLLVRDAQLLVDSLRI
ncbi:AAA family ATPase [soil metagenome]